uniref:CCHC-type domain-containing protein n=1 Tax=Parascaris univalens TaxID=6257 RepID=A0A915BBR4_PARUN
MARFLLAYVAAELLAIMLLTEVRFVLKCPTFLYSFDVFGRIIVEEDKFMLFVLLRYIGIC